MGFCRSIFRSVSVQTFALLLDIASCRRMVRSSSGVGLLSASTSECTLCVCSASPTLPSPRRKQRGPVVTSPRPHTPRCFYCNLALVSSCHTPPTTTTTPPNIPGHSGDPNPNPNPNPDPNPGEKIARLVEHVPENDLAEPLRPAHVRDRLVELRPERDLAESRRPQHSAEGLVEVVPQR